VIDMGIVLEVSADNWDREVLQSDVLTVVDFWHVHCSWCHALNPVLDEIASEYRGKVRFAKIDVLKNPANREIAVRYGVMGTPTLISFCNGRPVDVSVGFAPKDHMRHRLDDLIAKHKECVKQSTQLEF